MVSKSAKLSLIILLIIAPLHNSVMAEDSSTREACFSELQSNMSEIGVFEGPYWELWSKSYSDLDFSRYYKNMSSFWIDINEPLFEMRLHSFGRQTGYMHPPYSPFASSTQSERWDEAAREFIVAEEYITKPDGTRQFLSCSFMQILSDDLMEVTSENYLYDWEIISVIIENDSDYKVWYNENVSFNHDNRPFVTWKRLFIYPSETQNDYFDRYSLLESFPSNRTDNYNFLSNENFWEWTISVSSTVSVYDSNWNLESVISPSRELYPVEREWNNEIFPLFTYYQDIEDTFPEFGQKLALRWELSFDSMKSMIGTRDNSDYTHIWNTVLDPRGVTQYMLAKESWTVSENFDQWEIEFYENNISMIGNIEQEINNVSQTRDQRSEISQSEDASSWVEERAQEDTSTEDTHNESNNAFLYIMLLIVWIIWWVWIYLTKSKWKK